MSIRVRWSLVGLMILIMVSVGFTMQLVSPRGSSEDESSFELLILHNNDMHAVFEQTGQHASRRLPCSAEDPTLQNCYGGFARVATIVKEARKNASSGGTPVLYLNAGDTYTGTSWYTIYRWRVAAEFINLLRPDAITLGNHEFDDGVSGLTPFIKNVTCPVLVANLDFTAEPNLKSEQNLKKSIVIEINNNKIGIVGYLTPDTKRKTVRNNVEFNEEISAIKREVARLKKEGVKIFIALGHSGFSKDCEIAKEVEDIDVVIGGHTNTFLWSAGHLPEPEKPVGSYPYLVIQKSNKIVPVVQAYAYTKYLGKLYLKFDTNGDMVSWDGNPILLDRSIPQDPDVLNITNKYQAEVSKRINTVLGISSDLLDGTPDAAHYCRLKECNIGNLVTDSMVYKYASEFMDKGDMPIAIIQGGALRPIDKTSAPINVTVDDVYRFLPHDGNLVKVAVNGTMIRKMLEHSVDSEHIHAPSIMEDDDAPVQFLQLSGIRVTYDMSEKPGQRVISVSVRNRIGKLNSFEPLQESLVYNILMSTFLADGGDGYSFLKDLPSESLDFDVLSCLTKYLKDKSPVSVPMEGNRIILDNISKI